MAQLFHGGPDRTDHRPQLPDQEVVLGVGEPDLFRRHDCVGEVAHHGVVKLGDHQDALAFQL